MNFLRSLLQLRTVVGLLCVALTLLFIRGWLPGMVVFSNDGPLGIQNAAFIAPGDSYASAWMDISWVGLNVGARLANISTGLAWLLGPVLYSKFYAPFSLLVVGLGAWFFFRELGFGRLTCVLGGVAAALNSDFLATACWGVAAQPICFGLGYFAMGLVANLHDRPWLRTILAGLAVGMGVAEAFDIGAIFSVFVGTWVVVSAFRQNGPAWRLFAKGLARLALVTLCAGIIALSAIGSLIGYAIKGVVGTAQDDATKALRWHEATQWSVPKREVVGLFVPGFFGFRMDTPHQLPEWQQKALEGGAYWGFIGRDASWFDFLESDRKGAIPGQGRFLRYGGGAGYLGMLVLISALWAMVQSFRGEKSCFTASQRKMLWFWMGVLVVSAALMFGKFAPFYQFFYALPYASTIRNPAKFLHVFSWAIIIVAGYGWHGLTKHYLESTPLTTKGVLEHFGAWWRKETGFDKKWVVTMFGLLALALVAWGIYTGCRPKVEAYIGELNQYAMLQQSGRADPLAAANAATSTFNFSLRQIRWAVVFLALTVGLLALIISGAFAGKRARLAGVLLGTLLAIDLGWQAQPSVIAQNWKERYVEAADNPVIALLKSEPYQHRVTRIPERTLDLFRLDPRIADMEGMGQSVYSGEWMQHLFPYYNIQCLNVIQLPRRPVDYDAFETAAMFVSQETLYRAARRLQLSSTDYIIAAAPLVSVLNQAYDAKQQRFKPELLFEFYQNRAGGPILTRTNQTGPFALIKFAGALPRAKLYADWNVATYDTNTVQWLTDFRKIFPPDYPVIFDSLTTNDLATLELVTRASFDPASQVLLAEPITTKPETNATPGTVEYLSYNPKRIVLKTKSTSANVMLLNDRYDPNWRVTINGQPGKLLRCNYLMRGVEVPAGEHLVEFRFAPDTKLFYFSFAAMLVGVALLGYLMMVPGKPQPQE